MGGAPRALGHSRSFSSSSSSQHCHTQGFVGRGPLTLSSGDSDLSLFVCPGRPCVADSSTFVSSLPWLLVTSVSESWLPRSWAFNFLCIQGTNPVGPQWVTKQMNQEWVKGHRLQEGLPDYPGFICNHLHICCLSVCLPLPDYQLFKTETCCFVYCCFLAPVLRTVTLVC